MKLSWQVLAALSVFPLGAALAQTADLARPAAPPPERSAEHQSLIEVAQQGLDHALQSAHELSIAVQNARREGDMLLVTCLNDSLETARTAQSAATANLGRMNAAETLDEARSISSDLAKVSKDLHDAMENAARCQTSEEAGDGETVVTTEIEGAGDSSGSGGSDPSLALPDITAPPIVPQTASPMR